MLYNSCSIRQYGLRDVIAALLLAGLRYETPSSRQMFQQGRPSSVVYNFVLNPHRREIYRQPITLLFAIPSCLLDDIFNGGWVRVGRQRPIVVNFVSGGQCVET